MSAPRLLSNRYELGDTLGYGGMSEVHHGHDVRLGREVAIKVLRADLARDPQFLERFRREAQNAAALNHPAIVAVYDTGETQTENGPLPYIVMEFVQGQTLRDIVKTEGPLTEKRAMEVMADVCAALDFSHRHGIVHRDVKPANVMITKTGAVKVMDFGIARAIHDGQSAMTQTAAVIGTAQYLSPEQARGETVDARSDVYAAGCVLYELVTGEPPFTGDSPVAVAYQHVREDPHAPSTVNPVVSSELDAVVLKALSKGPANRYQSSAEMRSDLVRTLSGQRPAAPMVMSDDERTQVMDDRRRSSAYDAYDDYDGPDPDEEDARKRKRRNRILIALAVVGVLAIAGIMWRTGVFDSNAPEPRAIPAVQGQTYEQAEQTLRNAGFQSIARADVPCAPLPDAPPPCEADQIDKTLGTDPAPGGGLFPPDQRIVVQVGASPEDVGVPNLAGKTTDEAKAELARVGLLLGQVEERDVEDTEQYGKVLAEQGQDPPSGINIKRGSKISIVVGKTKDMVTVNDYSGRPYAEAKAGLEGAGFNVERTDRDSDQPADTVISQKPNGAQLPEGSTVTLEVSNGSKEQIQLPRLEGKTEEEARAALRDAGWQGELSVQPDPDADRDDEGKVTKSNPVAGSQITKDQAISILVGKSDSPSGTPTETSTSRPGGFPLPGP
ncbi:serine/threonine protein kinase [Amycolatopsis antarctica]|uniref:non-specific serine/threonine protein kinase n=1 Tax=Amycolatopsis antarctica TaxID=1854586 RepID=A0A263D543_9PSEU|nr:Stk1 family PASTA domain-containing Ser/Thr kinase [Amycolatopsis antarctica]OZM72596.1 serine/threonine protein kinase [Amycolatopsis antarctica]